MCVRHIIITSSQQATCHKSNNAVDPLRFGRNTHMADNKPRAYSNHMRHTKLCNYVIGINVTMCRDDKLLVAGRATKTV